MACHHCLLPFVVLVCSQRVKGPLELIVKWNGVLWLLSLLSALSYSFFFLLLYAYLPLSDSLFIITGPWSVFIRHIFYPDRIHLGVDTT
ncbi:uncharacterized protein BX664DRAFT_337298 [Halteromyces radiatus]|uniref:uncharacterized protein n=1 Tax=Halteromyces radiatus TaxID=101107 RepID=UPI00221E826A|nr:uncharacterized protein BX664DRAFT_337298 [Halteromyces radiatus]KAI8084581.1 hypothetical protein BX664DRAFT_337298 [Halteromyces radiatus]